MIPVNSLVVYDSQFGNTERVAHIIARALGEFGPARAAHVHETAATQLRFVDLLVFGSPTQGRSVPPAIRRFVERLPPDALRGPRTACFDTRARAPWLLGASAASQLVRQLRRVQVEVVGPPVSFYVKDRRGPLEDGEAERATAWAKELAALVAAAGPGRLAHP